MRVDYRSGFTRVSEWICVEHQGFARTRADLWWLKRGGVHAPVDVTTAVVMAHELKKPKRILVAFTGKYPEIKQFDFGEEKGDQPESMENKANPLHYNN